MDKLKFDSFEGYKNIVQKHFETLDEYKRHQIIGAVYLTLTLFSVSFFGIFAIQPTLATISGLQKQYEDNQRIDDALTLKLQNLSLLKGQYNEFQNPEDNPTILARIFQAVPIKLEVPLFARKVEKLARDNQITIIAFSVSNTEVYPAARKEEEIQPLTFNLAVEGDQARTASFSSLLANIDRVIGVESISLTKPEPGVGSDGATSSQLPRTSISGKIYYNRDK